MHHRVTPSIRALMLMLFYLSQASSHLGLSAQDHSPEVSPIVRVAVAARLAERRYELARESFGSEANEYGKRLHLFLLYGVGFAPKFTHLLEPEKKANSRLNQDLNSIQSEEIPPDARKAFEEYQIAYLERAGLNLSVMECAQKMRDAYNKFSATVITNPGVELRKACLEFGSCFERVASADEKLAQASTYWLTEVQKVITTDRLERLIHEACAREDNRTSVR